MTDSANKALLPAGMSDVLAPDAQFAATLLERLMAWLASHGYARIEPPLIEFEEGLLTGLGAGVAEQTFRLMDPVSQRMMAVRADITPQIARIAGSRMTKVPRPLRLSYAGQVLRVRGSQLRPERQFTQAGAELIGSDAPAADAEAIVMPAGALMALGVNDLSVDLGLPGLAPAVYAAAKPDAKTEARLRLALDRKDAAGVAALKGTLGTEVTKTLAALLAAAGPAAKTLAALDGLGLVGEAAAGRALLADVAARVRAALPDLRLTIDPVENRGFEYHTGVTFTFFARGVRGELGSGGRYVVNGDGGRGGEPATGFTLFMDAVLRALPGPKPEPRLYVPAGTPERETQALRADGWITVVGLEPESDAEAEAKRMKCSHVLRAGKVAVLAGAGKAKSPKPRKKKG